MRDPTLLSGSFQKLLLLCAMVWRMYSIPTHRVAMAVVLALAILLQGCQLDDVSDMPTITVPLGPRRPFGMAVTSVIELIDAKSEEPECPIKRGSLCMFDMQCNTTAGCESWKCNVPGSEGRHFCGPPKAFPKASDLGATTREIESSAPSAEAANQHCELSSLYAMINIDDTRNCTKSEVWQAGLLVCASRRPVHDKTCVSAEHAFASGRIPVNEHPVLSIVCPTRNEHNDFEVLVACRHRGFPLRNDSASNPTFFFRDIVFEDPWTQTPPRCRTLPSKTSGADKVGFVLSV